MDAASARPAVFVGIDIGKTAHYAVALDARGATVRSWALPNDEAPLKEAVQWAQEHHGQLVVDQLSGGAALLLQLAWDQGVPVVYLHGHAMAQARSFYAGASKTDPKDAFVLADVARAHPQRVVPLTPTEDQRAELVALAGFDDDLRTDANRLTNRLRDRLSMASPALERAFGDRLATPPVLALLQQYPSRERLRAAGEREIAAVLRAHGGRQVTAFAARLVAAAERQTVTLAGAAMTERIVREVAEELARVLARRAAVEQELTALFFQLPEAVWLTSLPGVGARLGTQILVEIGTIRRFASAAHLASYAGLGPVDWRSGQAVQRSLAPRGGNRQLRHALFVAAFASLGDPLSRAYYDKKRGEGKTHTAAVLCLARRKLNVVYALLSKGEVYRPKQVAPTEVAA